MNDSRNENNGVSDAPPQADLPADLPADPPVAGPPADPSETDVAAPAAAPASRRWLVPVVGLAGLVVVGSLFVAYNATKKAGDALGPASGSTTSTTPAGDDFTKHKDEEFGFSISYPKEWERLEPPAEQKDIRLLLSAGGQDSLLVRVVRIEQEVTAENLGDVKAFTDSIVSGADIKVLQERTITLGGMPGFYYLYSFNDEASGTQGLHAHYFLFQGKKMNTLVFQALPADNFAKLADTFDTVAESFSSNPE